jgi:uncharacterized protein YdeI (YjbR/CyaY-like superfamily)
LPELHPMDLNYSKTSAEWQEWLQNNYSQSNEVWLVFHKKESGLPSMDYEDAVNEALCFGWIDSIIKKIDEQHYARKFTPRNENSKWSASNKVRIENLINSGLMTKIGLAKIEAAKKNGQWEKTYQPISQIEMPPEFEDALGKNEQAKEFYDQLKPTFQKQFILWIITAKRPETKDKRIKESIELLENGQQLGLR